MTQFSHGCAMRIPAIQILLLSMLVVITGCASLDADRELELAAITSNRITGSLSAQEAWKLPVQGESPVWDGLEPLTYDAAVGVALQGDPSLRSALAVIVERRAQYVQEGLPPNPTVAFGLGIAVDGMAGAATAAVASVVGGLRPALGPGAMRAPGPPRATDAATRRVARRASACT